MWTMPCRTELSQANLLNQHYFLDFYRMDVQVIGLHCRVFMVLLGACPLHPSHIYVRRRCSIRAASASVGPLARGMDLCPVFKPLLSKSWLYDGTLFIRGLFLLWEVGVKSVLLIGLLSNLWWAVGIVVCMPLPNTLCVSEIFQRYFQKIFSKDIFKRYLCIEDIFRRCLLRQIFSNKLFCESASPVHAMRKAS